MQTRSANRMLIGAVTTLGVAWGLGHARAQAPSAPPAVATHIAAAKAAGGELWPAAISQMCGPLEQNPMPAQPAPAPAAPNAAPAPPPPRDAWYRDPEKVFDNVYVLATKSANGGVSAWAITTSAGIILIDATYDYSVKEIVDDGLRKLGLNPADIKVIFVTHNHRDHVGGAKYLQDLYKPRVYMAPADWDIVRTQNPTGAADGPPVPARDLDATDGQRYTLGDTTITVYITPGHTPGTLSFLMPVKIKGVTHMAAFWGGTGIGRQTGAENLALHSASAARLDQLARAANADVLLSNHDGFSEYFKRIDAVRANPNAPNPFVVDTQGVSRMFRAVQECSQANIAALQR
jgi:metallo-beta-lactamase class B